MNLQSLAWNRSLIGEKGGLHRLDTPALVLDLDAFEHNVAAMAELARARGVKLRPHAKTHKCVTIAKAQIAAGAVGQCCAKLGEAEALADGGVDHLLITATQMGESKIARLLALNTRVQDLMVVVDDGDTVRALGAAVAAAGQTLKVVIVNDVGTHRFGVTTPAAAVELARVIAGQPALKLVGIQGYAGHAQHVHNYAERERVTASANEHMAAVRDALTAAGFRPEIVTGSGTGTHDIDSRLGVFTELQVGSYIFMDVDYDQTALTATGRRFRNALFLMTRVISNQQTGFVTTDAGSKCFATDGPKPVIAAGAPAGSTYTMFGDQFGRVTLPEGTNGIPLGTMVKCVVPHCDPNVNLWDQFVCVRGDTVEAIWPIEGRGAVA